MARRHRGLQASLAVEFGEERVAAEELDPLPLTRGDADARVQRLRRAGVDDGEVDLTRRLEVGEIRRRRAVRRDFTDRGLPCEYPLPVA